MTYRKEVYQAAVVFLYNWRKEHNIPPMESRL